ncbi:hypothetical protein [Mumia zhuanghuii]|uniref:Uncharacterized protein n=1 Tax=Mumia zhuanghuii TaxID=2585211 RepID=A0A5C4MJV2_9ACTN|nr:hypothetical protein [Mumia zhuanghuii]TNC33108.1 hypothetical protein FHE65_29525 [Mumia zhuanghuii]TNC44262.1 hypothetical protein FHE65_16765 [Mumia zhuanghuii]
MTAGYQIALPTPWEQIPVGADNTRQRVAEIAGRAVARVTADMSPDEAAKLRITLEQQLLRQLAVAERGGAVDFYMPTDLIHGMALSASFTVSVVMPDAMAPAGVATTVMTSLIAEDEASEPVSIGDTVWIRSDRVTKVPTADEVETAETEEVGLAAEAARELVEESGGAIAASRTVEYTTVVPSDERYWLLVTFTTLGDGDPQGELADLLVELFDAIMSTWRWETAE